MPSLRQEAFPARRCTLTLTSLVLRRHPEGGCIATHLVAIVHLAGSIRNRLGFRWIRIVIGAFLAIPPQTALAVPSGSSQGLTPSSQFSDQVTINVVQLDLFAEDSQGRPVDDLRPEELQLFEDGKPVSGLYGFTAPAAGHTENLGDEIASASPPSSSQSHGTSTASPTVAIFLDMSYLDPGRRQLVIDALRVWMRDFPPSRAAWMVVSFDHSLQILLARSTNRSHVDHLLEEIALGGTTALVRRSAQQTALDLIMQEQRQAIESKIQTPCPRSLVEIAQGLASQQREDAIASLQALQAFAASMTLLPGRRLLLYVSEGFPLHPGRAAYEYIRALCDGSGVLQGVPYSVPPEDNARTSADRLDVHAVALDEARLQLTSMLDAVTASANSDGVTVWTLDANGLSASGADASSQGRNETVEGAFRTRADLNDPFTFLAEETGGHAIINRNSFIPALRGLNESLQSEYLLAFQSRHFGDARIHRLRLETTRKGVRLFYRRSWRDSPDDQLLAQRVRASLFIEKSRPGLGESVSIVNRNKDRVTVRVSFERAAITLVSPSKDTLLGRLRIEIALLPKNGDISQVRGQTIELSLPAGSAMRPLFVRDIEIPMPLAGGYVAVGAKDLLSGDWAVERIKVPSQ